MLNEYELFPYYRKYPAWYTLGLHKINDSWLQAIRSPFQIRSFFEYTIERYCVPKNPCAEITIGKSEVCWLGVRRLESPFSLTDFRELYVIGPWEECLLDQFIRHIDEKQWSLAAYWSGLKTYYSGPQCS